MKLLSIIFCSLAFLGAPASTVSQAVTRQTTKPAGSAAARLEDCACESQQLPEVLALVNGINITKLDLSDLTQTRIKQLQQQVIEARKAELDLQINSLLLTAEATKLGTTTTKLLETEVVAKAAEPTEAEALAFYDENKSKLNKEFKDLKGDLISYLKDERQRALAQTFAARLRAAAQVKTVTVVVTPPANQQERARVFATVSGKNITSADIEDSLRPLISNVQKQVYELRKQDVDLKINDILLEQEASRRGITTKALLEAEVNAKPTTITDADAEKFYNENKARITGEFLQLKTQIVEYLKDRADRARHQAFADRLRAGARIQIFLIEPEPPVYNIAIDDQPMRGNPNAATTVVVFTDFQCPSCAQQHPVLERLIAEYGDRVRFVMRDYPLSQHKEAAMAAFAAEAAREQGKYWEYIAVLFSNQSAIQVDKLKEYATQLKLDRAKFDLALESDKIRDKVLRDQMDGNKAGVNSTPTTFINGRKVLDQTYEGLQAALNASLKG